MILKENSNRGLSPPSICLSPFGAPAGAATLTHVHDFDVALRITHPHMGPEPRTDAAGGTYRYSQRFPEPDARFVVLTAPV